MRRIITLPLLLCMWGCSATTDRMVEEHQTRVASELVFRQKLADSAWSVRIEAFRAEKHAALKDARSKTFVEMKTQGKDSPGEYEQVADYFAALHGQLDLMCDKAIVDGLKANQWMAVASDTILAAKRYQQTKDTALIEGGIALLESFSQTYVAQRKQPANAQQQAGQTLLDQMQSQLTGMLKMQLGGVQ